MYQSLTGDQIVPQELLWKDTPYNKKWDFDYLVEVIDWDRNINPNFALNLFMEPIGQFVQQIYPVLTRH